MKQEEVWDVIAEKWADFRTRPTDEVVDFLAGKKGKVLDLGCGSGRHAPDGEMDDGEWNVSGLEFYGVDFSEKLLRLARKRGYVEVKKGDVSGVPYDDGFFDYVVFARVLHCVEGVEARRKALSEVFRVLRSGGEALIVAWGEKGCNRLGGKREGFVPWSVGEKKVKRYTYIYDVDELRSELEDVGFEVLRVEEGKNIVVVVGKS